MITTKIKIINIPITLHTWFYFLAVPHVACGILVTQPGIEPVPTAMEAQRPNHWTAKGIIFL